MAKGRSDCSTGSSKPTLGPSSEGSRRKRHDDERRGWADRETNVRGTTMTNNNRAMWPDLVFAFCLMLAGLLMLRYGVWHLVNHHEVLGPLLAGGGAIVLGVFSVRQVLRSSSPHRSGHKRKPRSSRIPWWLCAMPVIWASFGSAQVATDTTRARIAFPDALNHGAQTTGSNKKIEERRSDSIRLPLLEQLAVARK